MKNGGNFIEIAIHISYFHLVFHFLIQKNQQSYFSLLGQIVDNSSEISNKRTDRKHR